ASPWVRDRPNSAQALKGRTSLIPPRWGCPVLRFLAPPRALPWADIFRPSGAKARPTRAEGAADQNRYCDDTRTTRRTMKTDTKTSVRQAGQGRKSGKTGGDQAADKDAKKDQIPGLC